MRNIKTSYGSSDSEILRHLRTRPLRPHWDSKSSPSPSKISIKRRQLLQFSSRKLLQSQQLLLRAQMGHYLSSKLRKILPSTGWTRRSSRWIQRRRRAELTWTAVLSSSTRNRHRQPPRWIKLRTWVRQPSGPWNVSRQPLDARRWFRSWQTSYQMPWRRQVQSESRRLPYLRASIRQ